MPNNVSNVGFFGPQALGAALSPDTYQQQLNLQAQQGLVSNMMGEGMQPINPNRTAGRFVVPISPLEGLAHSGQALAAALMQKNINKQQSDLAQKQMQGFMQLFRPQTPAQPIPQAAAGGSAPNGLSDSSATAIGAPWAAASQIPQQPPQPVPQVPQAVPSQSSGPLSISGMSPEQSMLSYMMNPQAYMGSYLKQFEPTDFERNLAASGYKPGSPEYQQSFQHQLRPNMSTRYGIYDQSGNIIGGAIPPNAIPIVNGPNGPEAQLYPHQAEAAAELSGKQAGAEAAAKTPHQLTEITLIDGRKIKIPVSYLTGDQGQTAPPQPGKPGQEKPTASPRVNPLAQGQTTTGEERQRGIAKSGNEYVDQLRTNASGAVEQNRMLDELDKSLQNFTPGKAAAWRKAFAQWKVQIGIASPEDKTIAASAETGDKITGQLVSNALRRLSTRPSQMEFQIFKDQYVPNLNLTPQGASQVIQFMRQVNNLDAQKYQQFNQWKRNQPSDVDYRDFDLEWNRTAPFMPLGAEESFPRPNIVKEATASHPQRSSGVPQGVTVRRVR